MTGLQVWLHPSSRTKFRSQFLGLRSQEGLDFSETRHLTPDSYTLRRFGGLQPLCGIGRVSLMDRTSIPAEASARTADSRPDPGPLTRTSTVRTPLSRAM